LDELAVWNRVLTPFEVKHLYNYGVGLAYPLTVPGDLQINIGDAWKRVEDMKINIGDAWKAVAGVQINIGDSWKTFI
jgi:hypothetical protein